MNKKDLFKDIDDAWNIDYSPKNTAKTENKNDKGQKPKKMIQSEKVSVKSKANKEDGIQNDFSFNIENLPEFHDFY